MKRFIVFFGFFSLLFSNFIYSFDLKVDEWKRVYLATYPRSGNHWIRFLIEEASGIATSSVYKEIDGDERHPDWINTQHLDEEFPWGGYSTKNGYTGNCRYPTKEDIVIIKTHFPAMPSMPFDRNYSFFNIRIIRNPIDSCWSSFIRHFIDKNYPNKVSHDFVVSFIEKWKNFQEYWNHDIDCINIRYEDLLDNPKQVFTSIISIIGYDVSEQDIERAIAKYPPKNRELQHVNHFDKEDLELMKTELKTYLDDFGYQIP